jgi:two-component system, OmpR family, response regulator
MQWRVFLVEDLRSMHVLLTDLFAAIGGLEVVGTAVTEAEAGQWFEDHAGEWDLAIVDLVLAQGSGMGVIPRARGAGSPGRVVVFSSYASPAIRKHCIKLGADAVFDKSETQAFIGWLDELASEASQAS